MIALHDQKICVKTCEMKLLGKFHRDQNHRVVTPNDGLVRESSPNPLNSGLGMIVIYPET